MDIDEGTADVYVVRSAVLKTHGDLVTHICEKLGHHQHIEAETKWPPFFQTKFSIASLNGNIYVSIEISLKFIPNGPINNIPALVQWMAWRRPGDKSLFEPMMVSLWWMYTSLGLDELTHDGLVKSYMYGALGLRLFEQSYHSAIL